MAFNDPKIDDPLSQFYDTSSPPKAGERDPVTGIRQTTGIAHNKKLRDDEGKRKEAVSKRVILQLMQNDLGREWLFDLLTTCNVDGTPFHVNEKLQDFNCGALHVGNLLKGQIKHYAFKEYALMHEEAWDRQKNWEMDAADKN